MTEEQRYELNQQVAELLGWTKIYGALGGMAGIPPGGGTTRCIDVSYCQDLNACVAVIDAVKSQGRMGTFITYLLKETRTNVCHNGDGLRYVYVQDMEDVLCATAEQVCRAAVRAVR